jgi:hypothetical protein
MLKQRADFKCNSPVKSAYAASTQLSTPIPQVFTPIPYNHILSPEYLAGLLPYPTLSLSRM